MPHALDSPEDLNNTQGGFGASFGFEMEDGSPWTANHNVDLLQSRYGDFLVGGPKPTKDAPMHVECTLVTVIALDGTC